MKHHLLVSDFLFHFQEMSDMHWFKIFIDRLVVWVLKYVNRTMDYCHRFLAEKIIYSGMCSFCVFHYYYYYCYWVSSKKFLFLLLKLYYLFSILSSSLKSHAFMYRENGKTRSNCRTPTEHLLDTWPKLNVNKMFI